MVKSTNYTSVRWSQISTNRCTL